jgi:large-conductance mechanosensitive channel
VGVRYKNKNSLPSSLSLVLDESIRSSSAQIPTCYNCVIKGLHEYFIRVETCFFVIIAARCLFFVHTREREREKKKEREERAKTTPTKILYLQNTRNVEKKQVVATAFLPPLERERER